MEEPFSDVPAFIEVLVIRTRVGATGARRDDSNATRRNDRLSERIRVIGFIRYDIFGRIVFDQCGCLRDIVAGVQMSRSIVGGPRYRSATDEVLW